MRRRETRPLWILLSFLALTSSAASAQSMPDRLRGILASPSATASALEGGRKISQFCANCHGLDGNSKLPEVPNLAAQNPVYLGVLQALLPDANCFASVDTVEGTARGAWCLAQDARAAQSGLLQPISVAHVRGLNTYHGNWLARL